MGIQPKIGITGLPRSGKSGVLQKTVNMLIEQRKKELTSKGEEYENYRSRQHIPKGDVVFTKSGMPKQACSKKETWSRRKDSQPYSQKEAWHRLKDSNKL